MHIDDYSFGRIVIDKKSYTSDVIIYPDRVDSSWWRKEGHYLQKADLTDIIDAKPDILVLGTGNSGVMHVPEGTIQFLESKGITVFIGKTQEAVKIFEKQPKGKKVIGAFHLTC
jgi:hypothetical protein